jgi:NTE family protein
MAFHAGALKFLAMRNQLEYVKAISSVSGGSLLTGLIFQLSEYKWPTSTQYLEEVLPRIENLLSDRFVEFKVGYSRFLPDIPMMRKNAHWLTTLIESTWGVTGRWSHVPKNPKWTVNITNAETGKRVTVSGKYLECYQLGKTSAETLRLANVMSASAAVPGVVGPWVFDIDHEKWKKPSKLLAKFS